MKPECIQWRNSHISLKEVRKLTFRSRGPWVDWLTCAIDSLLSVGRFQLFTTALLLLKRRSLYRINCLVDDNEFISINYSLRRNILSTDDSDTAFVLCSCDFTYPGNWCWTYRSHTARVCVTHTAHRDEMTRTLMHEVNIVYVSKHSRTRMTMYIGSRSTSSRK